MKKLFLSSSFNDVAKLLPDFFGSDLKGKTVTFIPTAALKENVNFYVESAKKALKTMGAVVDELEVSKATEAEIQTKLHKNDLIYISGGNTFFLLQELKKKGADKIVINEINSGKLYIGESAGSMVTSPNIEYVKDMDDCKEAPELSDYTALNLIDFYPIPHYTNFPFKKVVEKMIAKYDNNLSIQPITNKQVILVNKDNFNIVQI